MTLAVECRDLHKQFGGVQALRGVSLDILPGRIHAIVGENGAGKSTLVRIVADELAADAGMVKVSERVGLVRQSLSVVPGLTVLESIIFGAEPARYGVIDRKTAERQVTALTHQIGLPVPLHEYTQALPIGLQQRVEVLGTLYRGARILLLDEPTALLTPMESEALFRVLRALVDTGHTVVFISHKLAEVTAHCDAVTVLRQGTVTAHYDQPPYSPAEIGRAMVGAAAELAPAVPDNEQHQKTAAGQAALELFTGSGQPLVVPFGSIIGIAGVAGNGQEAVVAHMAGVRHDPEFGPALLFGQDVSALSTLQRRRLGLRVIPADVRHEGSALAASLHDNLITTEPEPRFVARFDFLDRRQTRAHARSLLIEGNVICAGPEQQASELSGGNLQRLVVTRELAGGAQLVVAHEPTRGVDFAAARAIRDRLVGFARGGGTVLLLSSDLDELLSICDEIYVLFARKLVGHVGGGERSRARLGELLGGVTAEAA